MCVDKGLLRRVCCSEADPARRGWRIPIIVALLLAVVVVVVVVAWRVEESLARMR